MEAISLPTKSIGARSSAGERTEAIELTFSHSDISAILRCFRPIAFDELKKNPYADPAMKKAIRSGESNDIKFVRARPADFAELLTLIRAYYRHDGIRFRPRLVEPALSRLLRSPRFGRIWLMRDGSKPIGYVAFTFHYDVEFGGVQGVITDLFIRSAYRGKKLGARAIGVIDAHCRSRGIGSMELQIVHGNRIAERFYRKIGFRKLDRGIMARELS
ncbi:MAG: GNAT family N-acetyltransferase [Candidatus Binataceae bacterium]|nr:GNAT family N-acetyltransferase [Candidatus Binataceae bacterium]